MTDIIARITDADFAILEFIQSHFRCAFLDAVMPVITHLGAGGILWIILALSLICTKKYRRSGFTAAAALILCLIFCNGLLKNMIARTRPFDINTSFELLIRPPSDFSFPSGHTAASSAAAAALLWCGNKRMGIFASVIAALIAFSRLYLYVHFPSDVFAGAVLGVILAYAAHKIVDALYREKNKP